MPVNSNNISFSNNFGSTTTGGSTTPSLSGFIPVRVKDVNIVPRDNDKSLFQNSEKYWGVGSIRFEALNQSGPITNFPAGSIAFPLNTNLRTLPIVNEVVFVILGPSKKRTEDGDSQANSFYYTNSIPIWNSTDQNAYPSQATVGNTSTDTNSINDIEDGLPNNPFNKVEGPKFGEVFQDQGTIKNLYPQEGDIILEGRFGNSIRMSTTSRYSETFSDFNVSPQNPWSLVGNFGDPITIIRNGQKEDIPFDNWEPVFEDINNDGSSIYLTSTQNIPIEIAYPNLSSYGLDVTPPEDTTAELEKELQAEGNEFTSNNEADSLNQITDSVNVEPDLSTDPNRIQPLFPGVQSPSLDPSLGDIPDFEFPNADDSSTGNQGSTSEEDNSRESFGDRKRRLRGFDKQSTAQESAAQRKRRLRNKNKTDSGNSGRESFAERKRRLRGGG